MVDTVGPLAFSPEKKVPSFNNFSKNHWEIMAHGTSNRAPYPFLFPSMDPNGVPITTTNITRTRWFWTTSFPWIMIRWWNPLFGWLKITLVGEIIVRLGVPPFHHWILHQKDHRFFKIFGYIPSNISYEWLVTHPHNSWIYHHMEDKLLVWYHFLNLKKVKQSHTHTHTHIIYIYIYTVYIHINNILVHTT